MRNILQYYWLGAHEELLKQTPEEMVIAKVTKLKQQRPAQNRLIKRNAKKHGKNVINVKTG